MLNTTDLWFKEPISGEWNVHARISMMRPLRSITWTWNPRIPMFLGEIPTWCCSTWTQNLMIKTWFLRVRMQIVAYIPNHSDFCWSIPGFYWWHPQNVHCLKTNKNPKNSVAWMVPVFLHIPSLFRIFSCCPTQELKELEISFEVTSKDGKPRAKGLEIVGRDRGTGAEWSVFFGWFWGLEITKSGDFMGI